MTTQVERAVFDVGEASVYLHINEPDLRKLLQTGQITSWRTLGPNRGDWRISRAACDEWIALQEERGRMEVDQ